MMRETALMIWWAVGWGGWIDGRMLSTMRRCSPRGARDVLAAAVKRGWLTCHYVNSRCALYRVTEAGRMMASGELQMPFLKQLDRFRASTANGEFVPPVGWPHAREAAIATTEIAKVLLPEYDIEPHWVFPMCQLRRMKGQKTPDAMLVGANFCVAHEYERSRKPGREKERHSTWETLERYMWDVSMGAVCFGDEKVTEVVITPHKLCANELDRHIRRHCGAKATKFGEVLKWGWHTNGVIESREVLPEPPEE